MSSSDTDPVAGFEKRPGFPMSLRPAKKRIRVRFGGTTIADTQRAMVMLEDGHPPVYYFSRDAVRMELLSPTAHSTH